MRKKNQKTKKSKPVDFNKVAVEQASDLIRTAIESAESEDQLINQLYLCERIGFHLLASILFNQSLAGEKAEVLLQALKDDLREELDRLLKEKDAGNLNCIQGV